MLISGHCKYSYPLTTKAKRRSSVDLRARKPSALFIKYFALFSALVMLIVLILGITFRFAILNRFSEIFQEQQTTEIERQVDSITVELETLTNTTHQISNGPSNIPYLNRTEPSYTANFMQTLVSITSSTPSIDNIAVYYKEYDDFIISVSGSKDIDIYIDNNYHSDFTSEMFIEELAQISQPALILTENRFNYIVPMPPGQAQHYGWVVYHLSRDMLIGSIDEIFTNYSYVVEIKNNDTISHLYNNISPDYPSDMYITDGDKFMSTSRQLYDDYIYTVSVLRSEVLQPIDSYTLLFTLIIGIIGVLAIGFSYIMSLYVYRPIKEISGNMSADVAGLDEFTRIKNSLYEYSLLKASTNDIQQDIEDQLFNNLIFSSAHQEEYLSRIVAFTKLQFDKHFFNVLCMVESDRTGIVSAQLREYLQDSSEFELIYSIILPDKTVYVLNHNSENITELKSHLVKFENSHPENDWRIGVGETVDDLFSLSISYKDAVFILGYNFIGLRANVALNSDIKIHLQKNYNYPKHEETKLIGYVISANSEKVTIYVDKILDFVLKEQLQINVGKGILISVLNNLKSAIDAQNYNTDPVYQLIKVFMFTEFNDNEMLFKEFSDIVNGFVILSNNAIATSSNDITNTITEIIEVSAGDYNLSLNLVAEKVNMSQSYLTKLYKERTGYTVKEYIDKVRITNAKKMLTDRHYSIGEIAKATGYSDSNTFCRKFKSMEGVTPTRFREMN